MNSTIENTDGQKHLEGCSYIKTMLMLLVILYHSIVFWTETWGDTAPIFSEPILGMMSQWLNSFHIYCFVLISGYIFAYKVLRGGIAGIRIFY